MIFQNVVKSFEFFIKISFFYRTKKRIKLILSRSEYSLYCRKKILIAHRQPFISSIYPKTQNLFNTKIVYWIKNTHIHRFHFFSFLAFNMLIKVEILLFKTTIYLHRKKRKKLIYINDMSVFKKNVYNLKKYIVGVYPWAYLLILKSNLRHYRLIFPRKHTHTHITSQFSSITT